MKKITRKPWEYEQCENCGEDLTVLSECEEEGILQDGDEVECEVCGIVGTICCDSETPPYVSFYDDPAELTADLIEKCKALLSERKRHIEALNLIANGPSPIGRDYLPWAVRTARQALSPEPEATGGRRG